MKNKNQSCVLNCDPFKPLTYSILVETSSKAANFTDFYYSKKEKTLTPQTKKKKREISVQWGAKNDIFEKDGLMWVLCKSRAITGKLLSWWRVRFKSQGLCLQNGTFWSLWSFTSCAQATVLSPHPPLLKLARTSTMTKTVKTLGTSQRTASAWVGPQWRGGNLTAIWSWRCQPLTSCHTSQEQAYTQALFYLCTDSPLLLDSLIPFSKSRFQLWPFEPSHFSFCKAVRPNEIFAGIVMLEQTHPEWLIVLLR